MKQPEDSTVAPRNCKVMEAKTVASELIEMLDGQFNRDDVVKIAEWVQYLSTQD
ncbi:hypothetical protein KAU11_07460 [Candidatus Babeliales bacterium]|nr:hypothetical protein [Candidatus Babeliales bacterium]